MQRLFAAFGAGFFLLAATTVCGAGQPYEHHFKTIKQGRSMCGTASIYMILNHYRDLGVYTLSDCETRVDLTGKLPVITSRAEISRHVNGGSVWGASWKELRDAVSGLHKGCRPYYHVELDDRFTAFRSPKAIGERRRRLEHIYEKYLLLNRPVIIHLKATWPLPGHYVVVTGFDKRNRRVHYADPFGGISRSVDQEEFIRDKWYATPGKKDGYYRARWDGEWMGFYRLEAGAESPAR